jgi:hypothetical protein
MRYITNVKSLIYTGQLYRATCPLFQIRKGLRVVESGSGGPRKRRLLRNNIIRPAIAPTRGCHSFCFGIPGNFLLALKVHLILCFSRIVFSYCLSSLCSRLAVFIASFLYFHILSSQILLSKHFTIVSVPEHQTHQKWHTQTESMATVL